MSDDKVWDLRSAEAVDYLTRFLAGPLPAWGEMTDTQLESNRSLLRIARRWLNLEAEFNRREALAVSCRHEDCAETDDGTYRSRVRDGWARGHSGWSCPTHYGQRKVDNCPHADDGGVWLWTAGNYVYHDGRHLVTDLPWHTSRTAAIEMYDHMDLAADIYWDWIIVERYFLPDGNGALLSSAHTKPIDPITGTPITA